jgi:glutamate/tyrosine decarboxylase-like PLP-dependent enzyme
MYKQLEEDLKNIDGLLSQIKDKSVDYINNLHTHPSARSSTPISFNDLPEDGIGTGATIDHFFRSHFDKIVSSSGPRYWGFVTGGTTPAAIAGDWLTTVFDQNTQSAVGRGGASALVELETIDLMLELFGLPKTFIGGFVTGATMANFTGLAVGRQWSGLQKNNDIAREGINTEIKVLAATPHSSSIKALAMLGLGSNNLITVKTMEGDREAIDVEDLENKLKELEGESIIVTSSGGTVNTVDFDDMQAISVLHKKYSFYWHIDAAFGGFVACSPTYKHLLAGWENADSITIDCHKWMNVPYDSGVYLVNRKHLTIQLQTFQNSNAPYLGRPEDDFSYLNFGPENSRRFRALPAWFSLIAYGKKGFENIVENNIRLAKKLGERLEKETPFKLAAPVRVNVVCFTTKDEYLRNETLQQTLTMLNESGQVFITPTVLKGVACLRAAFVNWLTKENDIDIAVKELQKPVVIPQTLPL